MNLVLYHSKYGHTQQYAEWIGEALNCRVLDIAQVNEADLSEYSTVIYGEGVYAGSYNKINKFIQMIDQYPEKHYVFFSVSIADVNKQDHVDALRENITKAMGKKYMNQVQVFYFRGGLNYHQLNFVHRAMMKMMITMLKRENKEERSPDNQMMIDSYGGQLNFSDKSSIQSLVEYVQEI